MMQTVKLKVSHKVDAETLIIILTWNHYKVWMEVKKPETFEPSQLKYYVCFEVLEACNDTDKRKI